jgi:fluoride exporter
MSFLNISAVFLGGGLGAVARYGLSGLLVRGSFPLGTLAVNILGSFCIGLVIATLLVRAAAPEWRLFLATGLMGGFTTFSAFALETVQMLDRAAWSSAAVYICASVIGCVLACFVGLRIAA